MMELDCYQHYFFDDLDTEEDFYKSTAPSEDIWKKFELLPTPPMSPTRTFNGAALHLSPGDKLSWPSKFLIHEEECLPSSRPELCANLSSIIIRDCMWSSFSASKQLEKVNGRGAGAGAAAATAVYPLPQIAVRPAKAQCVSAATDCVDPAAVLTFPTTNSCRKPASSGSESRSESSDDDDDDEEEIDVVTVENKHKRMQLMNARKPVTIRVRADPCPKRFHVSVHRQQHNYAARSPDSDPEDEDEEEDDDEEPECKRSCSESSLTSDTEDTDRRKNHNFLERKRRNDLRSRFLALRDQIPGLESSKTPKVAILTHASEYLDELHSQERKQQTEKKRLKARQQQLLRKLSELKRS